MAQRMALCSTFLHVLVQAGIATGLAQHGGDQGKDAILVRAARFMLICVVEFGVLMVMEKPPLSIILLTMALAGTLLLILETRRLIRPRWLVWALTGAFLLAYICTIAGFMAFGPHETKAPPTPSIFREL